MNIRKFQWQSIPVRQYKDSFWSKAQDEQDKGKNQVKIDFDLLQEMFCEEKKKLVKKESQKVSDSSNKQKTILDGKRLMNVSISTSKIKTPFAAFCKIILACENKDSLIPLKKGRND